jgi:cell division protein FtsI (penicillin-binding protein 3)
MLAFYNAVANGGVLVKPQFVKEIRQGNIIIKKFEPIILNEKIASQNTINLAKELMEGVVEHGTAKFLSKSPFKIAGKTGTAQIAVGNKGYNKTNYNASFAGYFPAGNPKYSCIVVVSNPSAGKIYGGAVAAPVFKEIADKVYATRPDIHDGTIVEKSDTLSTPAVKGKCFQEDIYALYGTLGVSVNQNMKGNTWIETEAKKYSMQLKPTEFQTGIVPDVLGMNAKDAVYMLENMGMKTLIVGKGRVITQSVAPGEIVQEGQLIELTLLM